MTVRIRDDATWHDGQPVTAEDVVWSFEKTIEHNPNQRFYYSHVVKAEATGEHEVKFSFDAATHNPTGRQLVGADGSCELRAMDGTLGAMTRKGYELFFDGKLVSGADAQFYTRGEARSNCQQNIDGHPGVKVRCLFDGARIGGNE